MNEPKVDPLILATKDLGPKHPIMETELLRNWTKAVSELTKAIQNNGFPVYTPKKQTGFFDQIVTAPHAYTADLTVQENLRNGNISPEEFWSSLVTKSNASSELNYIHKSFVKKAHAGGTAGEPGSMAGLIKQNLDFNWTEVLLGNEHWSFLKHIRFMPTPTVKHQRARYKRFGNGFRRGFFGFYPEGGTPSSKGGDQWPVNEFNLVRQGTPGSVTSEVEFMSPHMAGADPYSTEVRGRLQELLSWINGQPLWGDSSLHVAPNGDKLEFDGLIKLMKDPQKGFPAHVIDKEGTHLKEEDLGKAAALLSSNGKIPDLTNRFVCVIPVSALMKFSQNLSSTATMTLNGMIGRKIVHGAALPGYMTQQGYLPFEATLTSAMVETNRPVLAEDLPFGCLSIESFQGATPPPHKPTILASARPAEQNTTLTTGKYTYFVGLANVHGESIVADKELSITTTGNANAEITFKPLPSMGSVEQKKKPICWRVYRYDGETSNPKLARCIAEVPYKQDADQVFLDKNERIPGCHPVVILSLDPDDISYGQLFPILKQYFTDPDFATSELFLLWTICCLELWAPERILLFMNVKGDDLVVV